MFLKPLSEYMFAEALSILGSIPNGADAMLELFIVLYVSEHHLQRDEINLLIRPLLHPRPAL